MISARERCASIPEALTEMAPKRLIRAALLRSPTGCSSARREQLRREVELHRVFGEKPGFAIDRDIVAVVAADEVGRFDNGVPRIEEAEEKSAGISTSRVW